MIKYFVVLKDFNKYIGCLFEGFLLMKIFERKLCIFFSSCGPKSYFTLFCNLIGYGRYEPVRTARDLKATF